MADAPTLPNADPNALSRIATVAGLAVALGLAVQVAVLVAKLALDATIPLAGFAADVASGVAWSVVICAGAAIGTSVARTGAAVSAAVAALFAPLAVAASRAASQTLTAAIGAAAKPAAGSLIALAGLKALEYGLLGFLLATLVNRGAGTLKPYVGVGAAIGLLFGAIALAIRVTSGVAAPEIAATAVNEIVFPIGCAAVVYVGVAASRAVSASTTG